MKKNEIRSIAILGIIFVAFSAVAFAAPFVKNGAFWLAYIFAVVSIVAQGYAAYTAFVKGDKAKSKLYGFPIARIGTTYMIAQLILSIIFMALAKFVPAWVVIIVGVLALSAAAIGLISTEVMRDEIEHQDVKLKKEVKLMRSLQSKTRFISTQCSNPALTKKLEELSDDLRYSDPVSSESLEVIETELSGLINELERAVVDEDFGSADKLCKQAKSVLAERNHLCKLNK